MEGGSGPAHDVPAPDDPAPGTIAPVFAAPAPRVVGPPAARDPERFAPVFVLAPARSNSSVVTAMLGRHPALCAFPELGLFRKATVAELLVDPPGWKGAPARRRLAGLLRALAEHHDGAQTAETVAEAARWAEARGAWEGGDLLDHLLEFAAPRVGLRSRPRAPRATSTSSGSMTPTRGRGTSTSPDIRSRPSSPCTGPGPTRATGGSSPISSTISASGSGTTSTRGSGRSSRASRPNAHFASARRTCSTTPGRRCLRSASGWGSAPAPASSTR